MRRILILLVILVLFAGCGSRPDAGIKINDQGCITTNSYGNCSTSFTSVRNNNTYYFDQIILESDEPIYLELTLTINSGELQVGLINYESDLVNYSVVPGQELKIKQWVIGDESGTLPIQFNKLS